MIEAIIFDCDGVLVNSEELGIEVERRWLASIGLHYEQEEFAARFLGLTDVDFMEAIGSDRRRRMGLDLPPDFFAGLNREKLDVFRRKLCAIEGVGSFVRALSVPVAVASSSGMDFLVEKLEWTGLRHLFAPNIFSADQVARGKPHPDLFLHAARRIGCSPSRCVVLEDSENGVRAGVAAEMTVWGFLGGRSDRLGMRLRQAGAAEIFADYGTVRGHYAAMTTAADSSAG